MSKSISVERIEKKIAELKAERDDMRRQAEQMVANYNGRISALEELINPPAEKPAG